MRAAGFKTRKVLGVVAAIAICAAASVGVEHAVQAQQTQSGALSRKVLVNTALPGAPATHEVFMSEAVLPPGGTSGRHYHHGVEIGYLLEGQLTIEHKGRPTATLKPGDSFRIEPEAPHEAKNQGSTPAKILTVHMVEKGKPLSEPVK
jgi:quercetin dioxygenase-like cupin family protein